jgi:glycosyltransferase involved in cell wall biosynthesis
MVLCGKGPEEEKIRSLIKEYRLENNVSLVGEKNHSEVLDLMNQCKLFLHPSSYEGFGIVCLEALAAGAPVISFCQPMKTPVKKWHIVNSPAEMKEKVVSILRSAPDYTPVHPYQIDDTARNIMKLFSL